MEREEREREAQALHIPTPAFRFVLEVVRRGGGRGPHSCAQRDHTAQRMEKRLEGRRASAKVWSSLSK